MPGELTLWPAEYWNDLFVVQEGEAAVQFANRVKAAIARQGGLVDLLWDGGLKREKVKDTYKEEQQKLYSRMIVGSHKDRSRSWSHRWVTHSTARPDVEWHVLGWASGPH